MLEVMLAVSLAGLVSVMALGILGMMDRADRTLDTRSVRVRELATLHGLLQDAFDSLVMSNAHRPRRTGGDDEEEQQDGGSEGPQIRPRIILRYDASPLAELPDAPHTPQRLEITTRQGIAGFVAPEDGRVYPRRKAVRGVLELRRDTPGTWALWWRPVAPDGSAFREDYESNRQASALRLAGGLTACRWLVFYRNRRVPEFSATWSGDLPAYIELEITTDARQYANWVFELGWTSDAEALPQEQTPPAGAGADATGQGAGGAVGGQAGAPSAGPAGSTTTRRSGSSAGGTR